MEGCAKDVVGRVILVIMLQAWLVFHHSHSPQQSEMLRNRQPDYEFMCACGLCFALETMELHPKIFTQVLVKDSRLVFCKLQPGLHHFIGFKFPNRGGGKQQLYGGTGSVTGCFPSFQCTCHGCDEQQSHWNFQSLRFF